MNKSLETMTVAELKSHVAELESQLSAARIERNKRMALESTERARLFTDDEIREMRRIRTETGATYKSIWQQFGERGGVNLVHEICTYKTYKSVR